MKSEYAQRFMFNGVLVFLMGLMSGFLLYFGAFYNGQVGIVVHLEGVLNGMFLMIVGLMWSRMMLSDREQWLTSILGIGSVWLNFGQAFWFAVMGRHRAGNVMPADRAPFPFETAIMNVVLLLLSAGLVACCVFVLVGLRRGLSTQRATGLAARVPV